MTGNWETGMISVSPSCNSVETRNTPNMRYSEEQLSSELLDQEPSHNQPLKIFICSTPRSGSYMLCRYMVNAGLGVPHEYFNPIIMRQIGPRLGLSQATRLRWRHRSPLDHLPLGRAARRAEVSLLAEYVKILVPRRCLGGVFAAKIHFDQYLKVLDNPVGRNLLNGSFFVYLYREDLLAQAISTHFANLTGQWGIDETVTTVPAVQPDFFEIAAINHTLQQLTEQDRGWRLFFGSNGIIPITISYERLCADPWNVVASIAHVAGLDPRSLQKGYTEVASPADRAGALPSKRDVMDRYLAEVRKIKDMRSAKRRFV
jgi:LPS sulfotransferase NodH